MDTRINRTIRPSDIDLGGNNKLITTSNKAENDGDRRNNNKIVFQDINDKDNHINGIDYRNNNRNKNKNNNSSNNNNNSNNNRNNNSYNAVKVKKVSTIRYQ
jgi:hypothetical protein